MCIPARVNFFSHQRIIGFINTIHGKLTIPLSEATSNAVTHRAWALTWAASFPVSALYNLIWPFPKPATITFFHIRMVLHGNLKKKNTLKYFQTLYEIGAYTSRLHFKRYRLLTILVISFHFHKYTSFFQKH